MSAVYTAHLAQDHRPLLTACGESWQGWQAPEDPDPYARNIPPHAEPGPNDPIRQCQACLRVGTGQG